MEFPSPEPGLVLSYSYLWRDEARTGKVEGAKARPAAIVLVQEPALNPLVTVVPITHSPPSSSAVYISLPPKVAAYLGLDSQPHWVIVNEANQFHWPGFDIERNRSGDFHYGFVPPNLLKEIAAKFAECADAGSKPVCRDDDAPELSAGSKPADGRDRPR